ncbi:MAG: type II toxin-antitoxin system Phd/YefM family antitoxin [Oscillospiraceae bacterium]|nr:type II toxin-antitoxin system Phd/YefM family antitoxin [Oscillospiraceae bacterium]
MPRIIPIRDLRDTGRLSDMCNESREPIFITKNGYGDMVIMSMAVYEERMAQLDIRDKILAGKAQADAGNLVDGPSAMEEIRKRHGISV